MTFDKLNLIDPIAQAVREEGYETPTPIQAEAIPEVLKGRDLLGCAQTGTGKTAAFSIPILQLIYNQRSDRGRRRPIKSLIVTPTRELAIQIGESIENYGRHTGLSSTVIFGGVNQHSQVNALKNGVDILVATPGRLLDLMNQKLVSIREIEIFVLDEADRMLDMGFIHDVKRLLAVLPAKRQSLFFSATMPPDIVKLANTILHNPVKVEVTPVSSTAETINQFVYFVDKPNKIKLLTEVLKNEAIRSVLVFTRTKHGADKVVRVLKKSKIAAEAIHGNKSQNARQKALSNFKEQTTRVLVATDIAARGIDVDRLEYVINYDLPNIPESYVHRIGRTGRAGADGTAFAFCDSEEKAYLKDIEKLIKRKIAVIEDHPYPLGSAEPAPVESERAPASASRNSRPQNRSKSKGSSGASRSESSARPNSPRPDGEGKAKRNWSSRRRTTR